MGEYLGRFNATQRYRTGARDQKLQQKLWVPGISESGERDCKEASRESRESTIARLLSLLLVMVVVFGPRRTELVSRHDALLAKASAKTVMSYGASCIFHEEKRATEHGDQPSID